MDDRGSATVLEAAGSAAVRRGEGWNRAAAGLVAALIAGWLTLGEMQRLNHADSLIPALVSLQRWTWFYWGQNRFGMLTALLALPVRQPLINLLFQNWMVGFCGVMVFPLVHAYLLGWRGAAVSGLLGAGVFLVSGPECFHQDFLLASQPYAVSSCLGMAGLMVVGADSGGRFRGAAMMVSAAVLFFLTFWVSLAAVFFVVPLFTLKSFLGSGPEGIRWKKFARGLLIIFVTALANWGIANNSPYREAFAWTPVWMWPGNCAALLRNVYRVSPTGFLVALLVLAGIGCVGWVMCRERQQRGAKLRASLICVLTGGVYFIALAGTEHVRASEFGYRYALPSVVLLVISTAILASVAVEGLPARGRAGLGTVLLVGLLVGTTARYGLPSYGRVRAIMDERFGAATTELLENRCTHVAGDYWQVWGSVFHANLVLHEAGAGKVIWGIADRSEVTRDLWLPVLKDGRIGVLRSVKADWTWGMDAARFGLPPLKVVGESSQIRIYEPVR